MSVCGDARLHVFLPVEGFVDGVGAIYDHIADEGLVIRFHRHVEVTEAACNDKISFHDFDLQMCDSSGLVTHLEIGFGSSARSNYREAGSPRAPRLRGRSSPSGLARGVLA